MEVKINDQVETKEKLTNEKPWFNGIHTFSSVKIVPGQEGLKEDSVLKISVSDGIGASGGLA